MFAETKTTYAPQIKDRTTSTQNLQTKIRMSNMNYQIMNSICKDMNFRLLLLAEKNIYI